MTKIQLKKMLAPHLLALVAAKTNIATGKWARGKALSEMFNMINWRLSPYKSFAQFLRENCPDMSYGSSVIWRYQYDKSVSLGYSWQNLADISKKVNYFPAVRVMARSTKRLSIKQFLAEVAILRKGPNASNLTNKSNSITLNLNATYVAKLEAVLIPYGYVVTNKKRKFGISKAFCKFLDTL